MGIASGKCAPPTADGLIHDPDPLVSNELVDSRATFLEKCQARAAAVRCAALPASACACARWALRAAASRLFAHRLT